MKKKRKRSTSSSTSSDTSSTSSDDSSSTSRKKSKKRKHKRRRLSHGSKKHKRRVSSCSDKTAEDEWFPAPANTSASYIDQKQSISKLLSEGEQSWEKSRCEDGRGRLDDAIDRSLENLKHEAQSEASRLGRPSVNGEVRDRHRTLSSTSECSRNRRDSSSSTQSEYSQKSDRYSKEFSVQGRKRSESERGANEKMDRGERNSRDQDNGRRSSGGSLKKEIPSNLMDIFSQIAEFEKEKKIKK